MTIESVKAAHLKTQRQVENYAREQHFQSKGRWEEEKTLLETIQDIEDRLTAIEARISKHDNSKTS